MSFKVQVGPPQIAIRQGPTVLVTGLDGQITWPSENGLYFLDTRIISNWAIYANGEPRELLNGGPINYHCAWIFLTNKPILTEDGPIPPRAPGLTISRSINSPARRVARDGRPRVAGTPSAHGARLPRIDRQIRGTAGCKHSKNYPALPHT